MTTTKSEAKQQDGDALIDGTKNGQKGKSRRKLLLLRGKGTWEGDLEQMRSL